MSKRLLYPAPLLTSLLAVSVLTACAVPTGRLNFESMSGEELAAYNAQAPYDERVVCREDPAIGTHLRRKTCMTYKEDYQAKRNDMEILRTVNSGPVNVDLR